MPHGAAAAALVLSLLASRRAAAQVFRWQGEEQPKWHISVGLGLVRRETGAWQSIHLALDSVGWDNAYPPCTQGFTCPPADQVVESRPIVPAVAVRRLLHGRFQARAFLTTGSPGKYPGLYQTQQIHIRPYITTVGAQGVVTLSTFWLAFGPTFYHGSVNVKGNTLDSSYSKSGPGLALGLGLAVPRYSKVFFEAAYERHWAGSITMPDIPVNGAPTIPSMAVPLSHSILMVGVGIRR